MNELPKMACPRCWSAKPNCPLCMGSGEAPDEKLSPNFHLSEFLRSESAARKAIGNEPDTRSIENLHRVAQALESVRKKFGPIYVTSGFRSLLLNKTIGGTPNSAHLYGHAADFVVRRASPRDVARWIAANLEDFDQVIDEPGWCHLGVRSPKGEARRQALVMRRVNGVVSYASLQS